MNSRTSGIVQRISQSPVFLRLGPKVIHHLDRGVFKLTRGRRTMSGAMLPVLMLTTTGRRSGQPRTVPVAAVRHGEDWLVVGSNFGQAHHPAWALNLSDEPRATVEYRGERFEVVAESLEGEDRAAIWPHLTSRWPPFDRYVERAGAHGRHLRVFRLRRA